MLAIDKKPKSIGKIVAITLAMVLMAGGLYLLSLVLAPEYAKITVRPIEVAKLAAPVAGDNRVIIPKIGVDIPYGEGLAALDSGAQWRFPERGNPQDGGNFIIAAHRLTIKPTPQETIQKSPFYQIDKLNVNDEIIINYNGKRYGYKISEKREVEPAAIEIENRTDQPRLTLYSCNLDGAASGRIVIYGEPLGEVILKS